MPNLPADPRPVTHLPERWAPFWILAFVALWPAPGIAEAVLALAALFTAVYWLQARVRGTTAAHLHAPVWTLTGLLFLAYWLPQLLSAFDAVDPGKVWNKVAAGLRYLPFMWLAALAVATVARRRRVFTGLGLIVALWTLDALAQALSGSSPLFWAMDQLKWLGSGRGLCTAQEIAAADRLSGVFGPCNLKFGQVLASMAPFALFAAGARWGRSGWLLATVLIGVVLVLAGSRASWITYALVVLFSGWRLLGAKWMAALLVAGVLAIAALAVGSAQVRERIARTTLAFSGDRAGVDAALSGRGQIWGAALCMAREHPVNGVGARGFREAWPDCNPAPAQTAAWGDAPALHAHQIVLEILAETGVLGLLLWLAGAALAFRAWCRAAAPAREQARPAMLALAVTVFPFNTHLAFYSTFWGGLTLLLAALYAGALQSEE